MPKTSGFLELESSEWLIGGARGCAGGRHPWLCCSDPVAVIQDQLEEDPRDTNSSNLQF